MHVNSLFAAASYLAAFAAGFEFTGPDVDGKLNLSAPLINITWIRGSSNAPESSYPSFDLWFGGPNADGPGTGGSGWELRPNVSNTDGFFLWNPARNIGSGDEDGPYLTNGKDYQFAAMFTNEGKVLKVERVPAGGYQESRGWRLSLWSRKGKLNQRKIQSHLVQTEADYAHCHAKRGEKVCVSHWMRFQDYTVERADWTTCNPSKEKYKTYKIRSPLKGPGQQELDRVKGSGCKGKGYIRWEDRGKGKHGGA